DLEDIDPSGQVEVARAAGCEAGVVYGSANAGEPRLVIETDPDQQRGRLEARELTRRDVDRVGLVERGRQARDAHALAAHRFDERLEVRRGRDDVQHAAAPRR